MEHKGENDKQPHKADCAAPHRPTAESPRATSRTRIHQLTGSLSGAKQYTTCARRPLAPPTFDKAPSPSPTHLWHIRALAAPLPSSAFAHVPPTWAPAACHAPCTSHPSAPISASAEGQIALGHLGATPHPKSSHGSCLRPSGLPTEGHPSPQSVTSQSTHRDRLRARMEAISEDKLFEGMQSEGFGTPDTRS